MRDRPELPIRILTSALIGGAAALLLFGVSLRLQAEDYLDFGIFYASGRAWLEGASTLYPEQNLNAPILLPLFGLFAALPPLPAYIAWQGANLLCLIAALALTARELRRPWPYPALGVVLSSAATFSQVYFGQIAWLLLLPITMAWRYWRRGRTREAAILMGLMVSLKPFLAPAILLLCRMRFALGVIAASAAAAPLLGVAIVAPETLSEWFAALGQPWHLVRWPHLASLMGTLVHRGLTPWGAAVIAALPFAIVLTRWQDLDADTQWATLVATCVLLSPLGWAYYLLWALPAVAALWPDLSTSLRWWLVMPMLVPVLLVAAVPVFHGIYVVPSLVLIFATVKDFARVPQASSMGGV